MKKKCSNPKHEGENLLDVANFSFNYHTKDKLQSWCKACNKKAQREWYNKNKDRVAEQRKNRRTNEDNTVHIQRRVIRVITKDVDIMEDTNNVPSTTSKTQTDL